MSPAAQFTSSRTGPKGMPMNSRLPFQPLCICSPIRWSIISCSSRASIGSRNDLNRIASHIPLSVLAWLMPSLLATTFSPNLPELFFLGLGLGFLGALFFLGLIYSVRSILSLLDSRLSFRQRRCHWTSAPPRPVLFRTSAMLTSADLILAFWSLVMIFAASQRWAWFHGLNFELLSSWVLLYHYCRGGTAHDVPICARYWVSFVCCFCLEI